MKREEGNPLKLFFSFQIFFKFILGTSSAAALKAEQTAWYQPLGNGKQPRRDAESHESCWIQRFPHKFIHPQKTAPGLPPNNMKPGPRAQQICGILSPFVDPNREGSCIPQPHLGFTSLLLGFKGVPNARPIARAFWQAGAAHAPLVSVYLSAWLV